VEVFMLRLSGAGSSELTVWSAQRRVGSREHD
jgi:hypothetical protein